MTAPRQDIILNVDDQDAERYIKSRDLRAGGFTVLEAVTGAEALRMVDQNNPALVLLDVKLPDISGHEVCPYIKKKWPEVMVLMTSATFTTSDDRTVGLDSGADSYLVQPSEPFELVAAVNALLRIRRTEDALRKLNESLEVQVKERTGELSRAIIALKGSSERMRVLLQTTYIYQGYMAPDGTLLDANRASLAGINGELGDVVGRPFWETPWFAGTPGMPEMVRDAVGRAANGEVIEQSIVVNLPTGERAFDMALRPVRNETGKVIGIVPEAVETTERLQAEEALRQSQKMEAIGQLTGGLAHDFNNLLTAVVGNLDYIRMRSSEPNVRRWAENAFNAAQRGTKLTAQLLAFSRTQKLDTVPVDVNALIDGMRDLLNQSLGANVTVKFELETSLPPATADVNQLELAVLNLSINSRDAMPEGGTVTITTATANPNSIVVSVADTGAGMPPDVLARAFDPFFTTKPTGKGTGLGLSQVYGIVRQAGGEVVIDSKVGKGTKVSLRLPRAAHGAASAPSTEVAAARSTASEKILLVDDDPDVRDIVSGVLSELGYNVVQASNGEEAFSAFGEFTPDLLIVDFAMPGMNGAEVVMAARKRNNEQKILFLSGFADSESLETAIGTAPLLRKPFRPVELAAAVRSALDGSGARRVLTALPEEQPN
jgi:DNA-binding response OmpR family regulator/nitrogen-specific signal transduction histidine kinase